jgi:hypothetical protein
MKLIEIYKQLIKENEYSLTGEEVADYIESITPDESDIPDYFISKIKDSNKNFTRQKLKIQDLIDSDESLAEYIESGDERYGEESDSEYQPNSKDLYNPIVVYKGQVMDGYSRISTLYNGGEEYIYGYVA